MSNKIKTILKKERTWELLFLGFLFCFYMGWAYVMPYNSCPDEYMRFEVANFIFENGTLPHGADPSIRNPIWGISYAFYPMLAYMIGAVFMKITAVFTTSFEWLVLAARMVSVLCGMGMAVFTMKIGKRLFKGWQRLVFIAIVTLLPQSVYMFTYVNTDSLALFSSAVILYYWICGLESKWDKKSCIGLAVGISICALSYYNAYGFILCSILLFGLSVLFCYEKKWDYQNLLKKGILISVIVLVLILWWFIRNYLLYDGDFLGLEITNYYGELYAQDGMKPSQKSTPQTLGMSVWEMLTEPYGTNGQNWIYLTATSFIGCFGYMELFLSYKITLPYLRLLFGGMLCTCFSFKKVYALVENKQLRKEGLFNWCMMIALLIPNVLNIYNSYTNDYQAQGRYSIPMLLPLAYFTTTGIGIVLERFIKKKLVRDVLYVILSAILLALVLYIYKTVIRATYLAAPLINLGI